MKILELKSKLEEALQKYGNIEVTICTDLFVEEPIKDVCADNNSVTLYNY